MPDDFRLTTLTLSGWRLTARRALFLIIPATAVLALVGYLLPAHRAVYVPDSGAWLDLAAQPGEAQFHSNFADGGPLPIVALLVAAVVAGLLRRLRFGAGLATGIVGAGAAIVAIGSVVLAHMFSRQESAFGEHVFIAGAVVLFLASCALFVGEPLVHLLEKRRLTAASRPAPLPRAIAV